MKKAEVLEEYYLEENKEEVDLVGWKVIGKIDKSKVAYHGDFSLKTTTEGWLDEFGIHIITSTGLVLVSDNCSILMKEDIMDAVTEYIDSDEFKADEATFAGALIGKKIDNEDINKWLETTQITYPPTYTPSWTYTPATTKYYTDTVNTVMDTLDSAVTSTGTSACNYITCSADETYSTISSSALADAITASISNYTATSSSC